MFKRSKNQHCWDLSDELEKIKSRLRAAKENLGGFVSFSEKDIQNLTYNTASLKRILDHCPSWAGMFALCHNDQKIAKGDAVYSLIKYLQDEIDRITEAQKSRKPQLLEGATSKETNCLTPQDKPGSCHFKVLRTLRHLF